MLNNQQIVAQMIIACQSATIFTTIKLKFIDPLLSSRTSLTNEAHSHGTLTVAA